MNTRKKDEANNSRPKDFLVINRRSLLSALFTSACYVGLQVPDISFAAGAEPSSLIKKPAIVVRTTENITEGSWVWLLDQARDAGIGRIYLLVKQDENNYKSARTEKILASGELLLPLIDHKLADGWDNTAWLDEFLPRARAYGIEVHAWWPCFQDAIAAAKMPHTRSGGKGSDVFVDPAFEEVQVFQTNMLKALLERYPFDGVALDWLRYNERTDGSTGPLGEQFAERAGTTWSKAVMKNPLSRAIWDDLRARKVASWVKELLTQMRPRHPDVTWSAFVLPWVFKEVSQSYRHLSDAGLDSLQPMIYWRDWKKDVSFTSNIVSSAPFVLSGRTSLDPVFDITMDKKDLATALDYLPSDRLGHVTWYHHDQWSEEEFQKLTNLTTQFNASREELYSDKATRVPPAYFRRHLVPAQFSPDASFWALICLGELYRRNALDGTEPIIPVLALHRFVEGPLGSGPSDWHTSTAYIDNIFAFLKAHKFDTISVGQVVAFMISEDQIALPPRPLAISIDDGSASIAELFEPRAAKANQPYAVGLITSWVNEDDPQIIDQGNGISDAILTWQQVKALAATNRVDFISHTHDQHRYAKTGQSGGDAAPAVISRLWIDAEGRLETESERLKRIFTDFAHSRETIKKHLGTAPDILVWPYGIHDLLAELAAQDAGYTHFFEFGGNAFAAPRKHPNRVMRVSVMLADEAIPIAFPDDVMVAQRWWLAFQKWARNSQSIDLIEASIAQLSPEHQDHPEVLISNAAMLILNGHSILAARQLNRLRNQFPHDGAIHASIDDFLTVYQELV